MTTTLASLSDRLHSMSAIERRRERDRLTAAAHRAKAELDAARRDLATERPAARIDLDDLDASVDRLLDDRDPRLDVVARAEAKWRLLEQAASIAADAYRAAPLPSDVSQASVLLRFVTDDGTESVQRFSWFDAYRAVTQVRLPGQGRIELAEPAPVWWNPQP